MCYVHWSFILETIILVVFIDYLSLCTIESWTTHGDLYHLVVTHILALRGVCFYVMFTSPSDGILFF